MVCINKKEAKQIRERFPDVHIRRTAHKYYVEEARRVLNYLNISNRVKN